MVPADDSRKAWIDEHGTRFKVCPAQLADGVTCRTCKACAGARDYVVAFRAHGSRKRKVGERLREARERKKALVGGKAVVDYFLHPAVIDPKPEVIEEVAKNIIKLFDADPELDIIGLISLPLRIN